MAEKVVIRKYESKDHADVCRIFKDGMHENWWPAYRLELTALRLYIDLRLSLRITLGYFLSILLHHSFAEE